jgi:hypothetical protein
MYGLRMTRIAQRMISPRGQSAGAEVRRTRPRIEALEARLVLSGSGNTLKEYGNLALQYAEIHRTLQDVVRDKGRAEAEDLWKRASE